jgi:thiosulfate dehydrogenase
MARQGKAASFIWHNMPYGTGKSLSPQEAFDVAAYVTSQPRPDSPGKENDWPAGGAPADVPYGTAGHAAHDPPPTLARANPSGAIVPPPLPTSVTARGRATRER